MMPQGKNNLPRHRPSLLLRGLCPLAPFSVVDRSAIHAGAEGTDVAAGMRNENPLIHNCEKPETDRPKKLQCKRCLAPPQIESSFIGPPVTAASTSSFPDHPSLHVIYLTSFHLFLCHYIHPSIHPSIHLTPPSPRPRCKKQMWLLQDDSTWEVRLLLLNCSVLCPPSQQAVGKARRDK